MVAPFDLGFPDGSRTDLDSLAIVPSFCKAASAVRMSDGEIRDQSIELSVGCLLIDMRGRDLSTMARVHRNVLMSYVGLASSLVQMTRMSLTLIRAMPDQTPTNDKLFGKKFLFLKTHR
jgi:hypothetical protein